MNSQRVLKSHRYLCLKLLLVLVSALMIVSLSYSQPEKKPTNVVAYKMIGRLQVFSLEDKRAQIDDLMWDLANNFHKKEIPKAWKKGTVEFTEREVWVYYYVSSLTVTEASHKQGGAHKKEIELITSPEEIQKIREMGARIYKIEMPPA